MRRRMQRPHGRVEGREELVGDQYFTSRQRTHEGRLAGVRISDERDAKLIAPGIPALRVVVLDLVQLLLELREPIANLATVEFEVGLTGADPLLPSGTDGRLPQARRHVLQPRHLHLQPRFAAPRMTME